MSWHGHLRLDYYRSTDGRTLCHDRHSGPLRVLQRLYPEGPAVCHHVLVHPPGGIVGGDVLDIELALDGGTHALITTPGATRYYRSAGEPASQRVHARLAAGSRLEWLPLETIAYRDCIAENRLVFELAAGAQMIGCDVLALGLPASGDGFASGKLQQHLELPGVWLERALLDGSDRLLLDGPLGWAGQRVLGTLWFAAGSAIEPALRSRLLEAGRDGAATHALAARSGTTSPDARIVLCRVLGHRVEPVLEQLRGIWGRWRGVAWEMAAERPRIWSS